MDINIGSDVKLEDETQARRCPAPGRVLEVKQGSSIVIVKWADTSVRKHARSELVVIG